MGSVYKRGRDKAKKGARWYIGYRDECGKYRSKCSGTADKSAAERIANKLEADARLRAEGVIDPSVDRVNQQSRRPVAEHVSDYEHRLQVAGRSYQHVCETIGYIRAFAEFGGWRTAADIEPDSVTRFARQLEQNGKSSRTQQAYLRAVKGFSKRLAKEEKLPRDPLIVVSPPAAESESRRALRPEEWPWLEHATAEGPIRGGMTGRERLLLYRTAIQTGFRSNELRCLTRVSLYLDGDHPYIVLKASDTKGKRLAQQYILPELAAELTEHAATKRSSAKLFNMPDKTKLAGIARVDLAVARTLWIEETKCSPAERLRREQCDFLAEVNDAGEAFVFHSFRHTTGAWLALHGEHPKTVQTVMRHKSITLTLDTYGHLFPGQAAEAVSGLAAVMAPVVPQHLVATGTERIENA